jgi:NAD(P)-dependent dehydrogenase (short-subunit alcohol dehydrogenase family)
VNREDGSESRPLIGQVAIVTGGGRGIGRAVAEALAAAGAAVSVAARSLDQIQMVADAILATGEQSLAIQTDVTDRCAVEHMVTVTERELGPVDLLVNNAGIFGPIGPIWEIDPDEWWQGVASHLRGTLLCSRTVLPGMIERRRGRIINVASRSGAATHPYTSGYAVAKAGVLRLTDHLAAETRDLGVSVFAIYPGRVQTAMTDELIESAAGRKWLPGERQAREGQWLSADHAARLCTALATGRADVLSGRFFGVFEDLDDLTRRADEIERNDLYTLRLRT